MTGAALWVAALTGGTAVLASWVTSLGNARAAKVKAEVSALADHRSRTRDARRQAYLDFLEQAHTTGELYYRLGDIDVQVIDPAEQLTRIHGLRSSLRDAFAPLTRAARLILLEGPAPAAQAADAVRQAAAVANTALWQIAQGQSDARDRFNAARDDYHARLTSFIEASRVGMTELS